MNLIWYSGSMRKLVLASFSPRRKSLLELLGIPFTIDPSMRAEVVDKAMEPEDVAKELSLQKAQDVASKYTDAVILGADSIVVLGKTIFGKPKNRKQAQEMLQRLQGTTHQIITGVTLLDTKIKGTKTFSSISTVTLRPMREEEIAWYVATGEPMDKAGSYAVQGKGGIFVKEINGDYFGIVGLPLFQLVQELPSFGISVFTLE